MVAALHASFLRGFVSLVLVVARLLARLLSLCAGELADLVLVEKAMDSDQAEIEVFFLPPIEVAEKTDVKITALSDSNNVELYARFMLVEIDD